MSRVSPLPEITPDIVLRAYSIGLFPMGEKADDDRLYWVEPEERGVFPLDELKISRSLAKTVRADVFDVSVDDDFDAVIDGCASAGSTRETTWINAPIRRLYRDLFDAGFVHTVECRRGGVLVGGLYGLSLGAAFFGESMFHIERDASKVALVHLAARLRAVGYRLLDTQFLTPHLATLGAIAVPRTAYRSMLQAAVEARGDFFAWPRHARAAGKDVLASFALQRDTAR